MTLTPIEGDTEKLAFSLSVDVLALQPRRQDDIYPMQDRLPWGHYPRLIFNDPAAYQTIAERNLLQAARGGIDKADYTVLTGIPSDQEVWFTVRTEDNTVIGAKRGDSIQIGSFSGRIVEIFDRDVVLERGGVRWLLAIGESLKDAFALPPETAERED